MNAIRCILIPLGLTVVAFLVIDGLSDLICALHGVALCKW